MDLKQLRFYTENYYNSRMIYKCIKAYRKGLNSLSGKWKNNPEMPAIMKYVIGNRKNFKLRI